MTSEAVLLALVVAAFVATVVVVVLRRRHRPRQAPPDPRHRRGAASFPTDVESVEPAAPAVEADTLFDAAATSTGWTEPDTLPGSPPPGATTWTEPDTLPGSPPPGATTSTEPDTLPGDRTTAAAAMPEGAPPTRRTARSGPPPHHEAATEPTLHQCPHCGHDDIVLDLGASAWTCGRCARQWSNPRGEPWPDVVLCLWLTANAPSQET